MYWPIGGPRAYAQELPNHLSQLSHDGIDGPGKKNIRTISQDATVYNGPSSSPVDQTTEENSCEPTIILDQEDNGDIIGMRVARQGYLFATITFSSLTVWQTKPTAVLVSVVRSAHSLATYGPNVNLLLRLDAAVIVLQTALGYLITYSLELGTEARAYQLVFTEGEKPSSRRRSVNQAHGYGARGKASILDGGGVLHEARLHFRMVAKVDAGIRRALAVDDELLIVTEKPSAIQCIRWLPHKSNRQTRTELLTCMQWLDGETTLTDIVYDRPMNIYTWVMTSGQAYTVQRLAGSLKDTNDPKALFRGYEFHSPKTQDECAIKAAINSRFSLVALGCADGSISVYSIRDYTGGVKHLRYLHLPVSTSTSGNLTTLVYSPDGYCLFAGYGKGWITWSVYGRLGATSFTSDKASSEACYDQWLDGVSEACWIGGGSDIILLGANSNLFWMLEFARSAGTGYLTSANIAKALLQTSAGFMIYQGHDVSDITAMAADVSFWHHVQAPTQYLIDQWPFRVTVISPNGRYLAVAGQHGLAHYSINSGRWKTFDDSVMENEFFVRGGMCWHEHVLVVAVETSSSNELRLYSRELPLDNAKILHIETLTAPAIHLAASGNDSILVYAHDNILDHYIITASMDTVRLVKVGQIALHGIIRAPPRVRAVSWIVPDYQLNNGDPSQDVAVASVIFLIDGKLVLLQPSATENGEHKYDMRVVANNIEYYMLARDNPPSSRILKVGSPNHDSSDDNVGEGADDHGLQDSLWLFDGHDMQVWPDVHELLNTSPAVFGREHPASISITVDFYPLSALLPKGVLFGVEADLAQKHNASFASFRIIARTALFLPNLLRHHLSSSNHSAALHISRRYEGLPYFAHALEILLHDVLEEEAERMPDSENALLPPVLSFLSSFPQYLEIIVQCTRKTELRSWRTLFTHLPPPEDLFEASLESGALKTAGGYLLVLHTLAGLKSTSSQVVRLLRAAKDDRDWDLCKELVRFLMALDESGATLEEALEQVELTSPDILRRASNRVPSHARTNGSHKTALGIMLDPTKHKDHSRRPPKHDDEPS